MALSSLKRGVLTGWVASGLCWWWGGEGVWQLSRGELRGMAVSKAVRCNVCGTCRWFVVRSLPGVGVGSGCRRRGEGAGGCGLVVFTGGVCSGVLIDLGAGVRNWRELRWKDSEAQEVDFIVGSVGRVAL
ncbi:hypothetical protein Tco_1338185 [Tanacetum coccineum]